MRPTDALIEALARDARPVRPLRSPALRSLAWLLVAGAVAALLVAWHGVRPDLSRVFADPILLLEWIAALCTGTAAAIASAQLSMPDRPLRWLALPAVPSAAWLGILLYGTVEDLSRSGATGLALVLSWGCVKVIVGTSVPLVAVMMTLLRHAFVVRTLPTLTMAALAAAAVSAAGLSWHHELRTAAMILLWHFSSILVVVGLAGMLGRQLQGRRPSRWPGNVKVDR